MRAVAREQNELLASSDRFYFGYLISLYGSTSGFTILDIARFARGTSVLARLQRKDIGAAASERAPLIEPSMIHIRTT